MADERAAGRLDGLVVGNELSGSVAGPSIQAGAIHGGVHFHHAATAPPPVPRQLLTPSAHFTNREAELAALDQLLNSGRSVFAILSGPGGVGKTALALRWAYQVQDRFPDGQLYVDLAGFSEQGPLDPGEVLGSFLRALGVPPQRVPLGLAEQSALYRSVTMGRSLLVLLDNAYSAAQVRALLPVLSSSAVLVTSRSRLVSLFPDGARMIEVAPLSAPDAVSLLGRVAGEDRVAREREPAEYLARMCGGLPIAVCLAAATVREPGGGRVHGREPPTRRVLSRRRTHRARDVRHVVPTAGTARGGPVPQVVPTSRPGLRPPTGDRGDQPYGGGFRNRAER